MFGGLPDPETSRIQALIAAFVVEWSWNNARRHSMSQNPEDAWTFSLFRAELRRSLFLRKEAVDPDGACTAIRSAPDHMCVRRRPPIFLRKRTSMYSAIDWIV